MPNIFDRQRLTPAQLRTVAERRFDDARYLCGSGKNARANGAIYLGGFVIECLLKAELLEKYPVLRNAGSPHQLREDERALWFLCYRSHDLEKILDRLPDTTRRIREADPFGDESLSSMLKSVCGRWTIFARYSPRQSTITEARTFLGDVRELKRWLRS